MFSIPLIVALTTFIGVLEPYTFEYTFLIPANSNTARTDPPAITPVPAARVIIKPAAAGTGVIAGGSVRAILELAGIRDVVSKSLGARTKLNMATAALNALKSIKTAEQVAELRGKTVEEILG